MSRQDQQTDGGGLGPGACYAIAATAAVAADYPIDVATKRSMSRGPDQPVPGLARSVLSLVRTEGWRCVTRDSNSRYRPRCFV